jgi:hypothetical protein
MAAVLEVRRDAKFGHGHALCVVSELPECGFDVNEAIHNLSGDHVMLRTAIDTPDVPSGKYSCCS